MEQLIKNAQEKNYIDFSKQTKETLQQKVAEKLAEKKYFKKLDQAKGITEASGGKEAYQKFYKETLKKFGVDSPSKLSDEKKKKFFDAIDSGWEADNETD